MMEFVKVYLSNIHFWALLLLLPVFNFQLLWFIRQNHHTAVLCWSTQNEVEWRQRERERERKRAISKANLAIDIQLSKEKPG